MEFEIVTSRTQGWRPSDFYPSEHGREGELAIPGWYSHGPDCPPFPDDLTDAPVEACPHGVQRAFMGVRSRCFCTTVKVISMRSVPNGAAHADLMARQYLQKLREDLANDKGKITPARVRELEARVRVTMQYAALTLSIVLSVFEEGDILEYRDGQFQKRPSRKDQLQ